MDVLSGAEHHRLRTPCSARTSPRLALNTLDIAPPGDRPRSWQVPRGVEVVPRPKNWIEGARLVPATPSTFAFNDMSRLGIAIFGSEEVRMVQVLPLSHQAVEAVEDMEAAIVMAAADGVICAMELAYLAPMVTQVVGLVRDADLARAAGMAVLKGGVGAKRAADLLQQIDEQLDAEDVLALAG